MNTKIISYDAFDIALGKLREIINDPRKCKIVDENLRRKYRPVKDVVADVRLIPGRGWADIVEASSLRR